MGHMALEVTRHEADAHQSEVVQRPPHPRLAPYMGCYTGYSERMRGRLSRVEVPFGGLPMILSLGAEAYVSEPGGRGGGRVESFIAGLQDGWVRTEFEREYACVQVNLTPLGAFMLLGRPMHELANRTLALSDVLGADGKRIGERLLDTPSWERRFEILDEFVLARFGRTVQPSPTIARAWQRLRQSAGTVPIAALAADAGCSPRHLIAQFRAQIGLPPKTVARVLRFDRAKALLQSGRGALDVALDCGYYDQAHLIRDFRALCGATPGQLERHLAAQLIETPSRGVP